jgi:hypothetical protein
MMLHAEQRRSFLEPKTNHPLIETYIHDPAVSHGHVPIQLIPTHGDPWVYATMLR